MIEGMMFAGSHNQQQGNCAELALHDVANLYGKVDGITDVASVMGTTMAASCHKRVATTDQPRREVRHIGSTELYFLFYSASKAVAQLERVQAAPHLQLEPDGQGFEELRDGHQLGGQAQHAAGIQGPHQHAVRGLHPVAAPEVRQRRN